MPSPPRATPTPPRSKRQAIPSVLGGRDLCGIAQTGTGKTAAFALPILQRLAATPRRPAPQTCRALVLSPTRELASQIADSFRAYGAGLPLSTAVVFGGVPIGRQRQQLARGVDILVATPGRLLDLIDIRWLTLSSVQILVLDEADRMLDLGFVHALKRIVKLLPRPRQTLLFSATMPRAIAALAEDYLDNPVKVVVTPAATTVERIDQGVVFVSSDRKQDLLATMLRDPAFARVLVFSRTKHGADRVVRHLAATGSRRPPFTATSPSRNASARSPDFARANPACWSPPTSPHAASTSTAYRTSSISSCRTCRKTTCTGSAEPREPARPASRSRFAAMKSARICATSRS